MRQEATATDDAPVSESVLDDAIAWQLRLEEHRTDAALHAGLDAWLARHPDHARAWRQLASLDSELRALAPLRAEPVQRALARPRRRLTTRALGGCLVLASVLGSAWVADRYQPLRGLLADLHTGTGEQRLFTLPDGSALALNSRTAVDLDFNAHTRTLRLRAGEIAIRTAHGDDRPLRVVTPHGTLRALGTRFIVRLHDDRTTLVVTESAVLARPGACAAEPADCATQRRVTAGEGVDLVAHAVQAAWAAPAQADAWRDGMLVIDDRPLAEVVTELRRHHRGLLSVAPEAASLRVTGTVSLTDIPRALQALTHAVPVQIVRRTGLWLHLAPATPH